VEDLPVSAQCQFWNWKSGTLEMLLLMQTAKAQVTRSADQVWIEKKQMRYGRLAPERGQRGQRENLCASQTRTNKRQHSCKKKPWLSPGLVVTSIDDDVTDHWES
jgi:hypothetical protein